MDEDAHDDGIKNGDDGRFRGREDACVDAPQDDDRGEQDQNPSLREARKVLKDQSSPSVLRFRQRKKWAQLRATATRMPGMTPAMNILEMLCWPVTP